MVNLQWNHFGAIPPVEQGAKASAERFYLDLKETFPDFVADFEQKFTAWQGKWFGHEAPRSSNADDRCMLPEYDPLLFLGPKTTPLVVFELSKPENFMATTLYNHLETDKSAKVDPDDIVNYLTLIRHANLIVELNHERAQRAKAWIEAWKAHCCAQQQQQQSNSNSDSDMTTSGKEYDTLVEMGPGIIAHVMLEYSKDQTGVCGPWCKLMHQLVCEKPMMDGGIGGQGGVDVQKQYEMWKDWFEHMDYEEAAEGLKPSYMDNFGTWS
ncbi:hypothetical protein C8A00DRAFT_36332 [Chaetomidium leptoderma]|uniref:Uncharacterized protein n=1 Tax=Chaetomidium leptoderma TaxID=669021 RepID=A0AAN6ZW43_9PEZI|nr:hypothetical protein C8A00DRAFT_36332 [Chaetomidium leptoderma]